MNSNLIYERKAIIALDDKTDLVVSKVTKTDGAVAEPSGYTISKKITVTDEAGNSSKVFAKNAIRIDTKDKLTELRDCINSVLEN